MFKKMEMQKRRERIKEFEKQEKRIKELKSSGQSKKKAESKQKEALTRKQQKNQSKLSKNDDEDTGPTESPGVGQLKKHGHEAIMAQFGHIRPLWPHQIRSKYSFYGYLLKI